MPGIHGVRHNMNARPQPGFAAPSFTALAIGGEYPVANSVSLADFKGETVVLYFYLRCRSENYDF